jgi:hypothetical protein
MLLFHPVGKYALSLNERWSSIAVVSAMALGLSMMGIAEGTSLVEGTAYESTMFIAGMVAVSLALPFNEDIFPMDFSQRSGKEKFAMGLIGAGIVSLMVFAFFPSAVSVLFIIYGLVFIIYNWSGIGRAT